MRTYMPLACYNEPLAPSLFELERHQNTGLHGDVFQFVFLSEQCIKLHINSDKAKEKV